MIHHTMGKAEFVQRCIGATYKDVKDAAIGVNHATESPVSDELLIDKIASLVLPVNMLAFNAVRRVPSKLLPGRDCNVAPLAQANLAYF